MSILAFDTSNYTTSVALLGEEEVSLGKLLEVPQGALGLRQQEALFQHIKVLPSLLSSLSTYESFHHLTALGVSTQPRRQEDSYMPCFLGGETVARSLATTMNLPLYQFSHQEGHLAAAAWSVGQEDLLQAPFLSWHLSGGTTELLKVTPEPQGQISVEIIGGTKDISAGQLIDRTGQKLGLAFPSGKAIDSLALEQTGTAFPLKEDKLFFSLSGMENKVTQFLAEGKSPQEISAFVMETLGEMLHKITQKAESLYGNLPILFSGGVASSQYLQRKLPHCLFPEGKYATDNAMGIAVLTKRNL
ncbi:MAG: DNA-binding protein [Eubacteriales bacterium]